MSDSSSTAAHPGEDWIEALIEEYSERLRRGEDPPLDEYLARSLDRVDEVRELLVTVRMLEHVPPGSGKGTISVTTPSHIGEFEILRELGRGGMGVVFLARQPSLDRLVALKLLPLQATLDARFLQRFQREARAAASLQHAHIVPVYGLGEHEGLHYFAMQYIEGHALDRVMHSLRASGGKAAPAGAQRGSIESLASALVHRELIIDSGEGDGPAPGGNSQSPSGVALLAARPISKTYHLNIARIGVQVADALAYAHGRGVLHRDVKPSNLLMDADGHVWIADFGLCKTSEPEALTGTSDLVGTVAYMAPEQIEGRADVRSDVYGLGVTLYELLTLQPAFSGRDRAGLVKRVAENNPPRPCKLVPDLPGDLEAVVLKAIAKLPEERYGTAEALAQDLRMFCSGRPVSARPPNALHLLRLLVRRNRLLASTVGAALLLIASVSVLYVLGLQRARVVQDRNLYRASVAAAAAASTHPETARKHLADAPESLRRWEWNHLSAALDDSLETWPGIQEELRVLELSGDGRRLLFGGGQRLVVREVANPQREWRLEGHEVLEDLALSRDGRRAVSVGSVWLRSWSLEGEPVELGALQGLTGKSSAVCLDAAGTRCFVGTRSGRIVCLDLDLKRELFELHASHGTRVHDLVLSPDGGTLLSGDANGRVQVWDLAQGRGRWLVGEGAAVLCLDVSPDGTTVAAGSADGSLRTWDLASGEPRASNGEGTERIYRVRFSPDGQELVTASEDHTLGVWRTADLQPVRTLRGHDFSVRGLDWMPDGRLISGDFAGTIKTWDTQVLGGRMLLRGHVADLWNVSFDAAGERIVTTSRDGTVRVWDVRTGRQLRVFVHSMPEWAIFTAEGDGVLAGYKDGRLIEWSTSTGEATWSFNPAPEEGRIEARLVLDPRRAGFFSSTHGLGVESWRRDAQGWTRDGRLALPQAGMLDVSPDGDLLAIGGWDGTCTLLSSDGLQPRFSKPGLGTSLLRVAFSPDGRMLATGNSLGQVDLWSVSDGAHLRGFRVEPRGSVFNSQIWSLSFSPDGSRLACATESLGISLWDPQEGGQVSRLNGPGDGYVCVKFAPDGRSLVSPAWDGSIRVWDDLGVQERIALRSRERPDALAGIHAQRGTFEGLYAHTLSLLRRATHTPEDLEQAYRLARGLEKDHFHDARAQGVLGEAWLRLGELEDGRSGLAAAVRLGDLAGAPSPAFLALLAIAEARLGQVEVAREALRRAEALSPGPEPGESALLGEARQALDG